MSLHVMSRPAIRRMPVVRANSGPTAFVFRFMDALGSMPGMLMLPLLTQPEKRRSRAALAASAPGSAARRLIKSA